MNNLSSAALAHLVPLFGGSLGYAIVALSLGLRVALLPLTLVLAHRAYDQQKTAHLLRPEIDALRARYKDDPQRLYAEISAVYRRHGYSPFDLRLLLGSFVQWPIFGLVYGAIRRAVQGSGPFLWMKTLATPDALLTLAILLVTAGSAYLLPNAAENLRASIIAIQVIVTFFIVWKLAAGLGLYWACSNLVGLGQNLWLRSRLERTSFPR